MLDLMQMQIPVIRLAADQQIGQSLCRMLFVPESRSISQILAGLTHTSGHLFADEWIISRAHLPIVSTALYLRHAAATRF